MHWNQVYSNGQSPSARCDAVTALLGDKLYIVGGTTGAERKNDVWWFNFVTQAWISEQPRNDGPAKITQQTSAFINSKSLVSWAGHGDALYHNTLWLLDTRQGKWEKLSVKYASPYCPSYAQTNTSSMSPQHGPIIFGGDDGCYSNKVQQLDMRNCAWSLGGSRGDVPTPRHSHSSVLAQEEKALYVVGGHDGKTCSDVARLDLDTLSWRTVLPRGEGVPPTAAGGAALAGDRLYLFGGFCGGTYYDKTTVVDLSHPQQAREGAARNPPEGRASCAVASSSRPEADFSASVMYCYGGYDGKGYLNDLHVLQST